MKQNVTMYTFSTCPYCIRAKGLLDQEGIPYHEIEISRHQDKLDELEKQTGCGTVPQIFVGEQFIGGCDDLMALHKNQERFNNKFKA